MRIRLTLLAIVLISAGWLPAKSQAIRRFNTFSYSVNDGLLQSTIGDIAYDRNNFCWLSFPNGIQKFDGKDFTIVPIQPGLPDDKFIQFLRCRNGDLLLSHSQGISKYLVAGNRFIQVYNLPGEKKGVQFIGEDEDIVYFYTADGEIAGIDCRNFGVKTSKKTGLPNFSSNSDLRPVFSSNIIDHKVAIQIKDMLYCWDLEKGKLIARSEPIRSISLSLLRMRSGHEVLYFDCLTNNALQLYDFNTNSGSTLIIKGKDNRAIGRCVILPWQNKALISFNERLYEFDTAKLALGPQIVDFQNQPVNATIAKITEDNFGNLCLSTVTAGIRKIIKNNYPVRYYGTLKKDDNNNIISIFPDKINNRILAGTAGNGLLVFDTLQHLIKHIASVPGDTLPLFFNCIIKDNKSNYILFSNSNDKVWILSADLSGVRQFPASSTPGQKFSIDYFGNPIYQDEKIAITQSQGKLYRTHFDRNTCTEYEFTTSYTHSGLYYKGTIISQANDELIYLDAASFKELKKIPFTNTGNVRCFIAGADGNIYLGSNKGIFRIDSTGKKLSQLTKENGLPDECIYAMAQDDQGALWCSSNKGIFKVKSDNSIFQLRKEDGLQENEFNTNVVAKAGDGELFFGGVNGLSSFYPSAINGFEEKIKLLITRIRINNEEAFRDTAVWDIEKISLPYYRNSLAFDFVAMAGNNPGQYIYQYKMEGIDDQWIQNDGLQTVRYLLPPGNYVLKIYASRFFNKDAVPLKIIYISINPPFWRTWWFIIPMILLLVTVLAYGINRYNKRKYRKKLMELESERKLQVERERISRDLHDNIGAYANAVLYNTELLRKEQANDERDALMNDLRFASKDIITALRETVWALKKDSYTAEECLLRIKNFIQPLSRYYPHINFSVKGEAPVETTLHYTRALNAVRIVQEALTNSIKHAAAKNINVLSRQKEGKWELTVTDDGNGFEYDRAKGLEQGNGLANMKSRASASRFEIKVHSKPAEGTVISIII